MLRRSILLAATTCLAACATNGVTPAEVAEQTATVSEAAAGPVAPATAERPQIGTYGFDTAGMDRSVEPGDDFYDYANGGWERTTPIPADKSEYGMFGVLQDLSEERTREILEEQAKTPGSKTGDFYSSFLDRAAVDAAGIEPLKPTLAKIEAAASKAALAGVMGELGRIGVAGPMRASVATDAKDPVNATATIYQSGLGLPDRDYYLSDDEGLKSKREAYRAYLVQMLTLAGEANAARRADAVLAFETGIARGQWTRVQSRDADKTYNRMSRAELAKAAPGFGWDAFLGAAGLGEQSSVIVRQPSAIAAAAKLIAATPVATLKDYLKLQAIDSYAPYLSSQFVDAHFAFRGTVLSGTPQNREVWKRGVSLVTGALGEEIGRYYVERYFPPEAKVEMDKLVRNVLGAMDRRIQGLEWMAPETKTRARAKLAAFTPKIGYPEVWRDYSSMTVTRDNLVANVIASRDFETRRQLDKLGKPLDRREWGMYPMTINAYANFAWNEIVFPAAILQPPFFDPKADPAMNYGGIGAVIGHEISHHFDDQGSKYDETGALKTWWTPGDVERFKALTTRLVQQYGKYEALPGKFLNGELTLGENIGDLAGLSIAYDAYRASLGGKEAPIIDGTTGDQRFYLGWAQVWRRSYREPTLIQRLLTDSHSPSRQRVAVIRNLDPWYEAFPVKPGDTLYLSPEERVRIW